MLVSRKELIRHLKGLCFDWAISWVDHEHMSRRGIYLRIQNDHDEEISVRLLPRILRDGMISREEWFFVA
jgi:hypothetical protein